ncbi:DUF5810 domain-containing protein [Haloarcula onubensis]|uniref:DUF5810 domain-containing protein n=1 Tax=Haloarcula onubensis TaxID=2950539 RepID=A0ABU2FMM4_9EURY|nr:DUF5810 domain-containing protein [Halomicroarcula sp. S3CR25-11]MDS0282015.1 DUF5810 domain-containing protein [Halomicroarcula sp. S3CR25-11]
MGYACPVCADPQADAAHLANHLAFTALTGGDDHEAWLDEHVPEWGQLGEADLAERVVDHAKQREFPQVFEESGTDDHSHAPDHGEDLPPGTDSHRGPASMSDDDAAVLAEARELTKAMLDEAESGDETGADSGGPDAEDETE